MSKMSKSFAKLKEEIYYDVRQSLPKFKEVELDTKALRYQHPLARDMEQAFMKEYQKEFLDEVDLKRRRVNDLNKEWERLNEQLNQTRLDLIKAREESEKIRCKQDELQRTLPWEGFFEQMTEERKRIAEERKKQIQDRKDAVESKKKQKVGKE